MGNKDEEAFPVH